MNTNIHKGTKADIHDIDNGMNADIHGTKVDIHKGMVHIPWTVAGRARAEEDAENLKGPNG